MDKIQRECFSLPHRGTNPNPYTGERRNSLKKRHLLESAVKDYKSIDGRANKEEPSQHLGVGALRRGGFADSSFVRESYKGGRNTALLHRAQLHAALLSPLPSWWHLGQQGHGLGCCVSVCVSVCPSACLCDCAVPSPAVPLALGSKSSTRQPRHQ